MLWSAGRTSTSLSQGPLPPFLLHQPKNGVSATNPVAVLVFVSIDEHTVTLKGREKVTSDSVQCRMLRAWLFEGFQNLSSLGW